MVHFMPSYIKLFEDGTLLKKVKEATKHLTKCYLCPHECGADRTKKQDFVGLLTKLWYQVMGLILEKKVH